MNASFRAAASILVRSFWACLYLWFGWAFWVRVSASSASSERFIGVLLMIQCATLALFFIIRRSSETTSWNIFDIVIAGIGTFSPMFLAPATGDRTLIGAGVVLQVAGLLLTLYAYLSLRRSIGVLPANRGVVTAGAYRFVRHPIYTSYLISLCGFIMNNRSAYNVAVLLIALVFEVARALREERVLVRDPVYQQYRQMVRWRFIPYLL